MKKKKKKKRRGSRKGGVYERELCRELSEWWSKRGDDDLFYRTHGSGSRATVRYKKGKKTRGQVGDVCAVDTRGATFIKAFPISVKRGYVKSSLQDIIDFVGRKKKQSEFEDWIRECMLYQRQTKSLGWMLILRKDQRKAVLFMPLEIVLFQLPSTIRSKLLKCPNAFFRLKGTMKKKNRKKMSSKEYMTWYVKNNKVVFSIALQDFLKYVDRQTICQMVKRYEQQK